MWPWHNNQRPINTLSTRYLRSNLLTTLKLLIDNSIFNISFYYLLVIKRTQVFESNQSLFFNESSRMKMNLRTISSAKTHVVLALSLLLVVEMTIIKQPHNNLTNAFLLSPPPKKKKRIHNSYLSNQNTKERTTHPEKQPQQENQQEIQKQNLFKLLSQLKPNQPTSQSLTKNILQTVKKN